MSLLAHLTSLNLILCPATRVPLKLSNDGLFAETQGQRWPVKNGALDLYSKYSSDVRAAMTSMEFTRAVASALNFPLTDSMLEAIRAAISDTALNADDSAFTAEIRELSDRLGIAASDNSTRESFEGEINLDPRISFERTFIEPVLPAGRRIRRTVRIRNDGTTAIASVGKSPILMSYHWLDSLGNLIEWDGARTYLPVSIPPAGSLSVICEIDTPKVIGNYRLQFQPLVEGVRWVVGDLLTLPVTIAPAELRVFNMVETGKGYEYGEDHGVGLALLANYISSRPLPGRRLLLEVGGGIHPQTAALVAHHCDVVSVDISFPLSQLGQLYFDHVDVQKTGHLSFVVCDAHNPPFPAATFDGVAIFAALHHFADPKRLLVNLRRIVKPGGFIAVMCEPCVPNPIEKTYLRDLEKGINEQCWTPEEHGEIFLAAGLKMVQSQLDGGSLKAILEV